MKVGEMMEQLDANREQIKADYLGGMKLKDICIKYSITMNTLKSWCKRFYWTVEKKASSPCELVLIHGLQEGLPYKQIVEKIIKEYDKNEVT